MEEYNAEGEKKLSEENIDQMDIKELEQLTTPQYQNRDDEEYRGERRGGRGGRGRGRGSYQNRQNKHTPQQNKEDDEEKEVENDEDEEKKVEKKGARRPNKKENLKVDQDNYPTL